MTLLLTGRRLQVLETIRAYQAHRGRLPGPATIARATGIGRGYAGRIIQELDDMGHLNPLRQNSPHYRSDYRTETDATLPRGFIDYWCGGAKVATVKIGTAAPVQYDLIRLTPYDADWLGLA